MGLEIHSFGFFYAIAFIIGIFSTIYYAKKEGIEAQAILDLALYVMLACIIGPRLFYVLGDWNYFINNPIEIIMVQHGGMVFVGGLVFSLATIFIFAKIKKIALLKLFDAIAPGVAFGYAIGRIGCLLNGCCFGLPTTLPWGIIFPAGSLASLYCKAGESLHPTQIYAAASMFLVFLFLAWLYKRKRFDGQIMAWWAILYALYRFLVEFLRYSPVHWLNLTPTQWLILPLLIVGIWILKRQNI